MCVLIILSTLNDDEHGGVSTCICYRSNLILCLIFSTKVDSQLPLSSSPNYS